MAFVCAAGMRSIGRFAAHGWFVGGEGEPWPLVLFEDVEGVVEAEDDFVDEAKAGGVREVVLDGAFGVFADEGEFAGIALQGAGEIFADDLEGPLREGIEEVGVGEAIEVGEGGGVVAEEVGVDAEFAGVFAGGDDETVANINADDLAEGKPGHGASGAAFAAAEINDAGIRGNRDALENIGKIGAAGIGVVDGEVAGETKLLESFGGKIEAFEADGGGIPEALELTGGGEVHDAAHTCMRHDLHTILLPCC